MNKFFLLINTLKYLKWPQFYFRIHRKLFQPKVTEQLSELPKQHKGAWVKVELYDEKISQDFSAKFLNHTCQLNFPDSWNDESRSKLWVYNLHYFEDLLSTGSAQKHSFHLDLLNQWICDNPAGHGNGWEPYPTSLRIPNILKAWLAGLPLNETHHRSLCSQASYLSNDLEKHLLGNHYFVNLKALLFAGLVYNNPRWLKIAIKGLEKEVPEQTLDDGANFELSPMYHALILVDMLDMYNLLRTYQNGDWQSLIELLNIYIPKALNFMEAMSHPDGGVSFFNDSVEGIAPKKSRIYQYASLLGFDVPCSNAHKSGFTLLEESGYISAYHPGIKLIFDAANVGPDYIPGHAHADTLSLEMSLGQERVFVNSGTSQYGLSKQRLLERKTCAHNTVEVDAKDSSEVWSGFRVAKRARVITKEVEQVGDEIVISAAHNGFKKSFNGPIHSRQVYLSPNKLKVSDTLKGGFTHATSRFYLHPDLDVALKEQQLEVRGKSFVLTADLTGLDSKLTESNWHPEFGLSIPNKCLEVNFITERCEVIFDWVNKS